MLAEDDVRSAVHEARDLANRVDELIRRGKIDGDVADRLDEATDALLIVVRADSSSGELTPRTGVVDRQRPLDDARGRTDLCGTGT